MEKSNFMQENNAKLFKQLTQIIKALNKDKHKQIMQTKQK